MSKLSRVCGLAHLLRLARSGPSPFTIFTFTLTFTLTFVIVISPATAATAHKARLLVPVTVTIHGSCATKHDDASTNSKPDPERHATARTQRCKKPFFLFSAFSFTGITMATFAF